MRRQISLFALLAALSPVAAQSFREKVSVELVRVELLATDSSRRPLPDLGKSEIRILVDGRVVPVEGFEPPVPGLPAIPERRGRDPGVGRRHLAHALRPDRAETGRLSLEPGDPRRDDRNHLLPDLRPRPAVGPPAFGKIVRLGRRDDAANSGREGLPSRHSGLHLPGSPPRGAPCRPRPRVPGATASGRSSPPRAPDLLPVGPNGV